MSTPNPLVPQGSLDRQSKGKSTVRIAIFTIISIHAVFFAGLLMQGCRQDDTKTGAKTADALTNSLPAIDTGYYPSTQEMAQATPSTPSSATNTSQSPTVTDSVSSLPGPVPVAELAPEGKSYTVAKGDTLSKIARAHGTTIAAITKANQSADLSKIHPGQKIQIPAPAPKAAGEIGFKEPGTGSGSGSGHLYTVKPGETLTKIAKQHGTTAKALRAANNLKSNRLLAGQKLKIPAPSSATASTDSTKPVSAHVTPVASTSTGSAAH